MMKNFKLVIGIVIAIIVISFSTSVLAADAVNQIILPGTNTETQNETNTTNVTNVVNTTAITNVVNNTTNTALPKTGVTDGYVVAILVTVCAISAIYAYRKIRDYNIK